MRGRQIRRWQILGMLLIPKRSSLSLTPLFVYLGGEAGCHLENGDVALKPRKMIRITGLAAPT